MKLLVIGSCTGDKDVKDCPHLLTETDFEDAKILHKREAELKKWTTSASKLYLGWQHRYMMQGVQSLRAEFGGSSCAVNIISAGYGLVQEEQSLVPYEVTFQGKGPRWVRKRAMQLGIPEAVRQAVSGFPLVVLLLGKEYLQSICPPLTPSNGQRFVYFTANPGMVGVAPQTTLVPAGRDETSTYHAGTVALKGKMFKLFASGLCSKPKLWDSLIKDSSSGTAIRLIEEGLSV